MDGHRQRSINPLMLLLFPALEGGETLTLPRSLARPRAVFFLSIQEC
jgi:hypothetical protein